MTELDQLNAYVSLELIRIDRLQHVVKTPMRFGPAGILPLPRSAACAEVGFARLRSWIRARNDPGKVVMAREARRTFPGY
jgi:hypothetical protein